MGLPTGRIIADKTNQFWIVFDIIGSVYVSLYYNANIKVTEMFLNTIWVSILNVSKKYVFSKVGVSRDMPKRIIIGVE